MSRCPSSRFRTRLLRWSAMLVLVASAARGDTTPAPRSASPVAARGSGAAALEPLQISARVRRIRLIYTCHEDGAVAFSDRPCGEGATLRSIALAVPTAPGRAPDTTPRTPAASTRSTSAVGERRNADSAPETAPASGRCSKLQAQLDDVDARMRQGYSAREAARLWNRWREIKEDLHAAHC